MYTGILQKKNEIERFELLQINNVPVEEIMKKIIPYIQRDGFNDNTGYFYRPEKGNKEMDI